MVSVIERHPRFSGLWLAPRYLLSGPTATGPPLGGSGIGREGAEEKLKS